MSERNDMTECIVLSANLGVQPRPVLHFPLTVEATAGAVSLPSFLHTPKKKHVGLDLHNMWSTFVPIQWHCRWDIETEARLIVLDTSFKFRAVQLRCGRDMWPDHGSEGLFIEIVSDAHT